VHAAPLPTAGIRNPSQELPHAAQQTSLTFEDFFGAARHSQMQKDRLVAAVSPKTEYLFGSGSGESGAVPPPAPPAK